MLYLVFAHNAGEPPLRLGPLPSFKVQGAVVLDQQGKVIARHNGHRWEADGRHYYRIDCDGPVHLKVDAAGSASGPFEHLSLVNGTVYTSREVFARYSAQDDRWTLQESEAVVDAFVVVPMDGPVSEV